MKIKCPLKRLSLLVLMSIPISVLAAAVPATQDWVLAQLQTLQSKITSTDWDALCSSGSPEDATGCWGNVSSTAFQKISAGTGGFTSYANIQPKNIVGSVFIKAFLGGTNTPVAPINLIVVAPDIAARCALFTSNGAGLGAGGVINSTIHRESPMARVATTTLVTAFNRTPFPGLLIRYEAEALPIAKPEDPIYLMCVGYDPEDGSTAVSIYGSISVT